MLHVEYREIADIDHPRRIDTCEACQPAFYRRPWSSSGGYPDPGGVSKI
jgi:hypothetical protein